MGMIVDCFLVNIITDDIGTIDRKAIIKCALRNASIINHLYSIEIPDDMAMALDHTGHIERSSPYFTSVRCYMIDWDETEKLQKSDFKFGD